MKSEHAGQTERNETGSIPEAVPDDFVEDVVVEGESGDDPERAERLRELQRLALAGEIEAPSGADELLDALVEAARERDEYLEKFQRSVADLENFRRRSRLNEQEARDHATRSIITSLLGSLDTFDIALQQDPRTVSAEQIMTGVRSIRDEIIRRLTSHGVTPILPEAGDEFEPGRHEAVTQAPVPGIEAGAIGQALQAGYLLGQRVIRPAKVLISTGSPEGQAE